MQCGLTVVTNSPLQIRNLSQRRILPAGAQQVAQSAAVNAPVAPLVEELEGFAVVCGGLVVVIHDCSFESRRASVVCSAVRGAWVKENQIEWMMRWVEGNGYGAVAQRDARRNSACGTTE